MYYWMGYQLWQASVPEITTSFVVWIEMQHCTTWGGESGLGSWQNKLDSLSPVRLVWAPVWLAQLVDEDIWMAPLWSNCPNLELSSRLVVLKWPLIRTDSHIANCSSSLCTILYKASSWATKQPFLGRPGIEWIFAHHIFVLRYWWKTEI